MKKEKKKIKKRKKEIFKPQQNFNYNIISIIKKMLIG